MLDQATLETLFGSVESGRWERILGASLVVLVSIVRYVTKDRFSENVGSWLSASSAILGGIGAAFLVGAVWWHALLIGLFVTPSSRGFWDKVRSSLPARGAALALLLFLPSCAAHQRCVTEQATVEAFQAGITSAEAALPDPDDETRLALDLSRGATILGDGAVRACETLRDEGEQGWQTWVGLALGAAMGVANVFTGASDSETPEEVPEELTRAIELLR